MKSLLRALINIPVVLLQRTLTLQKNRMCEDVGDCEKCPYSSQGFWDICFLNEAIKSLNRISWIHKQDFNDEWQDFNDNWQDFEGDIE